MIKQLIIFTTICHFLAPFAYSSSANLSHGENIFRQCRMCHGKNGDKSPMGQSRAINSLNQNEIYQALLARKNGEIEGAGNTVKARLSETDMQDVATFIQTLSE